MALSKQFIIFLVGAWLSFNAASGMFYIVSSLNIDEGLGTTSLAIGYGASLLSAPFIPWLGHCLGCKALMILGTTAYLLFIVGNLYTSYFTLIPAGFAFGLAESWIWTAMPVISAIFAERLPTASPHKLERRTRHYTGFLYTAIQAATVSGSGILFAILFVDRSISGRNTRISMPGHNTTVTTVYDYSVCGANDCQLANVTQANISQYKPAYPATRFFLIGLYATLCLISIILYAVYLPSDLKWPIEENSFKDVKHGNSSVSEKTCNDGVKESLQMANSSNCNDEAVEVLLVGDGGPTAHKPDAENKDLQITASNESKISGWVLLRASFKSTWDIFISSKHLMIAPLAIYNGLTIGFAFGELTRAYASCVLGVDKVGVSVMLYGAADSLFSFIAGKAAGRFGRNLPFFLAFVIDVLNHVFCLTWSINENNTWLVYLIFLSFGVSDGIWQTLITALYGEYFVEKRNFAYNLWNVVVNIGLLTQFTISTVFCVYVKLYLQLAFLIFAMLTYGASQLIYYPDECGAVCKSNRKQTDD